MPGSILGNEVRRVEDPDLLHGRTTFVDNLAVDGMLRLVFVRSPLPHAEIRSIDVSEASAAPGVVAVFTAADLNIPPHHAFVGVSDACKRSPLADGRVRFAGDAVAVVVAESKAAAEDAAELVDVDYDPLPSVVNVEKATAPDAPVQFEALESNVIAGVRDEAGEKVLADAEVVVRARLENQRLAVVPMEGQAIAVVPGTAATPTVPNGAVLAGADGIGEYDLTIYVSNQMPHLYKSLVARLFELPGDRLRVIAPHVGGAFGGKAGVAPEHTVAIAAARRLGRPVAWAETRSENMQAMPHSRAQVQYAELGLSRDGMLTGMRCRVLGDCGAYGGFGGAFPLGSTYAMAQGVYRIPKLSYDGAAVLTNTTPTGAFRGAGRPEAAAMIERMMDVAAAELGLDPAELRRRNLIAPEEFPFTTRVGTTYDSGDYMVALDEALRLADYPALRAEQARRREAGDVRQLGIGLCMYVEITAGGGTQEYGSVEIHADGTATISVGTSGHGQGHETSFAMVVADRLGLPMEAITFVQSDTATVPRGGGTGGARSLQIGGNAVGKAAGEVLEQARELAASLLEASVDDIVVADGGLGVAGVPARTIEWAELARQAESAGTQLRYAGDFEQSGPTFPFGTHLSVVEVDTETGHVTPIRHIAVDDCGRVLNPLIVRGQQHGGSAQGIAQALWEQVSYDEDGNLLSASLADYGIPSAVDVPALEAVNTETPTDLNPLGAKGIGESATVGATPAVQNAVVDALSHLGIRHIDLPCTPERVWAAIRDAEAGTLSDPWTEPPAVFATLPLRGTVDSLEEAGADI